MNILYVVPYVPDRIRTRPFNLIRGLSRRGHRVCVATLWTTDWERRSLQALATECAQVEAFHLSRTTAAWNCLRALPGATPLQAAYSAEPRLFQRLDSLLGQASGRAAFDIVHVEHLRGAEYGLRIRSRLDRLGQATPVIWDSVDCISLLFRQAAQSSRSWFGRWVTALDLKKTERMEGKLLEEFDRVLVSSSADAKALAALASPSAETGRIAVLPNGVDLEAFAPDPDGEEDENLLVMSGKMSYHANVTMAVHFVREIFPRIRDERPHTRLEIVGKDPTREVRALAHVPGVQVTGSVPDLRPHLSRAAVAVAPLPYAVGIQNKVLEAMACGIPVVASPEAAGGLGARPGVEILLAADPGAFARSVIRLLQNRSERRQMGSAGRNFVETHHDWQHITTDLETMYHELIRSRN